jgi:hypothetical protein
MNRPTLLPGQRRVDYGRQAAERDAALHEESSQMRDKQHGNYEIMLHDNSFSAFRGWGDGLLFVEEMPHRIRPAEETGVKVREDNSQWVLSVNDPMERPEYALDSLQMKSDHTLCVVCKDTLNYFCRYIDERGKVATQNNANGRQLLTFQVAEYSRLRLRRHVYHEEQRRSPRLSLAVVRLWRHHQAKMRYLHRDLCQDRSYLSESAPGQVSAIPDRMLLVA